ncbi:16S rRNA (guanine(527)-N(7))-methyltransferase RsmG [Halovulum sp. GXIMD14794]
MSQSDTCTRLQADLNVSRETCDRLAAYVALLTKWTRKINLISQNTVDEVWTRHILDSAQLWAHAPAKGTKWLDIGTGGGLPGLVIAILSKELRPDLEVILLESDQRKGAFLLTAVRELSLNARVVSDRIESAPPQGADIISARALAPLVKLLEFAERHAAPGAVCLFPKGRTHAEELTEAKRFWHVSAKAVPSLTDPASVLLEIGDFKRA